jgi:error-prone DNA polymerase
VGWNNPPIPWRELERRMSGRPMPDNSEDNPDGDNAPGYSHKRPPYVPDEQLVKRPNDPGGAVRGAALPQQLQLPGWE